VILQIIFTQHSKDEVLFNRIKKVLGCGNIIKYSTKNIIVLSISKFKDTYYKMIPLFNKYKIEGIKFIDFQDFCKVAELINKKDHLTKEGFENIRKIKLSMNRNRIHIVQ
jgi:predicted methyltransferase